MSIHWLMLMIVERALKLAFKIFQLEEKEGVGLKSATSRARNILSEEDRQVIGLSHRLVFETIKYRLLIDYILSEFYGEFLKMLSESAKYASQILTYEFKLNNNPSIKTDVFFEALKDILKKEEYTSCIRLFSWLERTSINELLLTEDPVKYLSLSYSSPDWFVKYSVKNFGLISGLKLLKSLTVPPPTYFRVNTLKASEDVVLSLLSNEGFEFEKIECLNYVFKVTKSKKPIVASKAYKLGWLYVQDLSSCLAVEASEPKPGFTVLDVCAAPGSKTTHLAQLMENKGRIISIELSKSRVKTWLKETSRMGVSIAQIVLADASKTYPLKLEADIVLIDPPCSNTGAFHKDPSLKWKIYPEQIRRFSELQLSILLSSADFVKPDGCIVYATCSVMVEENEMVVEKFLNLNTDFDVEQVNCAIGDPGLRGFKECKRLYPYKHMCNGFFIAKLVRRNS
ncbi:RsmB/NOP family class I SAM-dependent RNA methyltransferase [Candidatus Bathyarchaeota archaeon]|nr:RsmB/NOP family class I SAM-dependent RNA methyltransferase [Candidatus Bathyarchaeota archaeon]MBS7612876.1 RsmB/NOP family class I SAM-dependent RNA methyltransferase [Candidatus Bathyarchaeota archaeon]